MNARLFATVLMATSALSGLAFAQSSAPPAAPATSQGVSGLGDSQPTDIGRVRATAPRADGTRGTDAGGGLMIEEDAPKARSTVTRDFIDKQSPTANPWQLLRMLPGVNQSSVDAFGLNGGNIVVRGLNSDQIGLTIEGAPVNDSGNYALYPQEYVDAENLEQIALTHGSADLDSPHIESVGGMINIYMRDPLKTLGGFASVSAGSNAAFRVFSRVDTGIIPGTNARAFVSFSHFQDNHWRGPGGDDRNNFEGKFVSEFGDGNRVSFAFLYNEAVNNNYRNPTLAQWRTSGVYGFNYNAVPASTTDSNYYKITVNPFRNLILSAPSLFNIANNLTYEVTPYMWIGYGNGGGATALSSSGFYYGNVRFTLPGSSGNVLFYSPSITETYRPGIINKLTYTLDNNKIVGGYWFEWAHHRQTGPFTQIGADGSPSNVWGDSSNLILTNGQKMQKRDQLTVTTNHVLFLGDTISLMNDHLFFDAGIKQAFITRNGSNYLPGSAPSINLTDTQTLPTAAVRYKLNDENTVFASGATGFRTPQNYSLFDSFSVGNGSKTTYYNNSQKAETSFTVEVGHRFQNEMVDTAVTGFYTSFDNRLVSTTIPDPTGGSGLISTNINAGSQTSYGVEVEVGLHPIAHFRPYVSAELMHSELGTNYQVGNDFLPTKGKQAVRTPQVQFAVGIDYDNGKIFGNFNAKYVGSQYSTFMNDEQLPGYFTADATIGYHLPDFAFVKAPKIQLNVFNIFNNKYLSGIAGPQTNAKATTGIRGTTIGASSAPSYYIGAPAAFLVTLSSAF